MTFNIKLTKAPSKDLEIWDSNERLQLEWEKHIARRGAKNTQRNHRVYVGVFLRSFDALATTLEEDDIAAFVAKISTKCAKLMNGAKPQCLARQPIAACPLLLANGTEYHSCPRYQPLDPVGVWSYACSINRFYEFLLEKGRISRNPALPVMRDFASRHSALFDERRRKPRRRILSVEEVRLLVTQSPLHHGIAYLLMAKCFLRIHEALKLSWAPEHCNLEEGWMDLPIDGELGGKRLGNQRICLDAEALRWVRKYRRWWEENVKRDGAGQPVTARFLITNFGGPWGKAAIHNFNTALHARAVALGLMTGQETQRSQRINTHAYRAFATNWARNHGATSADLQALRGDLFPGALTHYEDVTSRLPKLYQKFGPVLDV